MTPRAPLTKERVEELRLLTQNTIKGKYPLLMKMEDYTDLLSILSSYSSLRAENERLRGGKTAECDYRAKWGMCDRLDETYELKAENEKLITEVSHLQHDLFYERQAREKVEAEITHLKPLADAVMGLSGEDLISEDWPSEELRRAAFLVSQYTLERREEKGETK
jgi:hypothetical protein